MSLNAAAMRLMRDKGLTLDDVVEIATAMEARRDPTNAERQARHRAKRQSNAVTVTRDPPNDSILTPEDTPDETIVSSAPRGRRQGKTGIPSDWQPTPIADLPPQAKACAEQWPEAAYLAQAEEFVGYWRTSRRKTSDWRLTWANRIVDRHGKVMRDVKFGVEYGPKAAADQPKLTPAEYAAKCDEHAATMDKLRKGPEADEWRRRAAQARQQDTERIRGPRSIGQLIHHTA